ncbi:MAG: acyltransferase [Verrucomicrobiales bacterium]
MESPLATAAFKLLPDNHFTGMSIISLATFWSNYYVPQPGWGLPAGTTAFWSLAIEEHYYLIFPVTFLFLRRSLSSRATAGVLAILCIAALAWRCILVFKLGADHDRVYYASDTRFDNILYGSIFALVWNPALGATWKRPAWQLTALAAFAAAVVLFTLVYRNDAFRNTLRYSIHGITLMPLFFYVISRSHTPAFNFLNFRPVVFLGKISYTFYLLHVLVLALVYEYTHLGTFDLTLGGKTIPMHMVAKALLAFGLTTLASWLIFLYVEQPAARLKHRLQAKARRGD